MPDKNQAALDFLLTRRSRPAKTLTAPAPSQAEMQVILTAAARTPDHGKLEPWRFVVLEKEALARLARVVGELGDARGMDREQVSKASRQYSEAELAVAVVSSPKDSEKVPHIEQVYSAGAVCLSMVNAALASGWGANWLSGWATHDREFCEALGLEPHESIAGMIHIGTETTAPPERPRPDLAQIVTWVNQ